MYIKTTSHCSIQQGEFDPWSTDNEDETKRMGLYQLKKLCTAKTTTM